MVSMVYPGRASSTTETLKRWLLTIGHFRAVLRASENELFSRADNVNHYQRAPSRRSLPCFSIPIKQSIRDDTLLTTLVYLATVLPDVRQTDDSLGYQESRPHQHRDHR